MNSKLSTFVRNLINRLPFGERIVTYFRRRLIFYTAKTSALHSQSNSDSAHFLIVTSFEDFLAAQPIIKIPLEKDLIKERFNNKHVLYLLHNDSTYLCYGWGVSGNAIFLLDFFNITLEINEGTSILFDFRTNEMYRKQGYYTQLLKRIISSQDNYSFIIYTAPINEGSKRGILSSGFTELSTHSKFSIKKLPKKLKKQSIFIKIKK